MGRIGQISAFMGEIFGTSENIVSAVQASAVCTQVIKPLNQAPPSVK